MPRSQSQCSKTESHGGICQNMNGSYQIGNSVEELHRSKQESKEILTPKMFLFRKSAYLPLALACFVVLGVIGMKSSPIAQGITDTIVSFASIPKQYAQYVFIGSYTKDVSGIQVTASMEGEGISVYGIDSNTGLLEQIGVPMMAGDNPSYLTLHPSKRVLYAINELGYDDTGKVYSIDVSDLNDLHVLNYQDSPGYNPSSISVDPQGQYLVMSLFLGDGGIVLYGLEEDGSVGEIQDFKSWGSNLHFATFDPVDGSYVLAVDIGQGLIKSFALDRETGTLTERSTLELFDDSGPRYLAWQSDLPQAFQTNAEPLSSTSRTLSAYLSLQTAGGVQRVEFDHVTGQLQEKENQLYSDCSGAADIKVLNHQVYLACRELNSQTGGVKIQKLREDGAISSNEPLTLLTDGFSTRNMDVSFSHKGDGTEIVQLIFSNEESDELNSVLFERSSSQIHSKDPVITKVASPEGVAILSVNKDGL